MRGRRILKVSDVRGARGMERIKQTVIDFNFRFCRDYTG